MLNYFPEKKLNSIRNSKYANLDRPDYHLLIMCHTGFFSHTVGFFIPIDTVLFPEDRVICS